MAFEAIPRYIVARRDQRRISVDPATFAALKLYAHNRGISVTTAVHHLLTIAFKQELLAQQQDYIDGEKRNATLHRMIDDEIRRQRAEKSAGL